MSNQLPPDIVIAMRRLTQALGDPKQVTVRVGDSVEATMIKDAAERLLKINTVTVQQLARAFEAWENEFREDPSSFLTPEECAALEVATLSDQRAIYLAAIMRKQGQHQSLITEVVRELVTEPVLQIVYSANERHLRRLLAVRVGMPGTYYDDGEASGTEHGISIDFMREPVPDIDAKLRALNAARAAAAPEAPATAAVQAQAIGYPSGCVVHSKPCPFVIEETREHWLAVREGHHNAAAEEYFSARPHLDTPDIRRVFYAGHCKGYDVAPQSAWQPDQADPTRADAIYHQAYGPEGKAVKWGVRSSSDPSRDMRVMESAIEFFYAVQRGVNITPEMLWKQVMGSEWVEPAQGEVVVTWNHDRTNILAVTRQNTEGQVLKVIAQAPAKVESEMPPRPCALNPADVHSQALYKGSGGFNRSVENGVRLTHTPTGIYAECQTEISKHANREEAWKLLERKVAAKTSPYYISGPYTTGEHEGQFGVAEVDTGRIVHFFKPCEFPTCAPHHPCTKPCFRNSGDKQ